MDAALQTAPVGVEHAHAVEPNAALVEPVPQPTQPAWPVDEK